MKKHALYIFSLNFSLVTVIILLDSLNYNSTSLYKSLASFTILIISSIDKKIAILLY